MNQSMDNDDNLFHFDAPIWYDFSGQQNMDENYDDSWFVGKLNDAIKQLSISSANVVNNGNQSGVPVLKRKPRPSRAFNVYQVVLENSDVGKTPKVSHKRQSSEVIKLNPPTSAKMRPLTQVIPSSVKKSQLDSGLNVSSSVKQSVPPQLESTLFTPSSVKKSVPAQLDFSLTVASTVKQAVPVQLDSNPSIIPSSVKQSVPSQLDSNPIKPIPLTTKTTPVVSNPTSVSTKSNPQTSKPDILTERQSNKPPIPSTTAKIIKSSTTTNSQTHSVATNKDPVTTITKTRRSITARKTVPGPRYESKSSENHNYKAIMNQRNVPKEKQGNDRGEKEVKRVEVSDKNEKKGEYGTERRKLTNPVTPEFVRREQRKKLLKQQQLANKHSPNKTNITDKSRTKSTLHV